jgi:4-hydroxy-4-methyl-2-oxoglutarate aldolase
MLTLPAPRVVVIQDVSTNPGTGSLLGSVHLNILRALGCVSAVTNGAVRDLRAAELLGFPLFAGRVSVSHSYVHVLEFGTPVLVDNLKIESGDLLHGDSAGIQTVPLEIARRIPGVAARIAQQEASLIALCQSPDFSKERLRAALNDSYKDKA